MPLIDTSLIGLTGPGVPPPFLLDNVAAALNAYSTRKVATAYSGAALRVRRASDNAEQDIGFVAGGALDESALTTFVGANSGYVATWYDQSGNARDLTQATTTKQPRIVNSGTVDKKNARPCLVFPGSDVSLDGATSLTTTGATGSAIAYMDSGAPNYARVVSTSTSLAGEDYNGVNRAVLINRSGGSQAVAGFRNSVLLSSKAITHSQLHAMMSVFDGTNHTMRVDRSAASAVGSTGTFAATALRLGLATGAGGGSLTGGIAEVVVWGSALSTGDRDIVEASQQSQYGTA